MTNHPTNDRSAQDIQQDIMTQLGEIEDHLILFETALHGLGETGNERADQVIDCTASHIGGLASRLRSARSLVDIHCGAES